MDNAKTLESELQSAMSTCFTIDVKQITIPTLLVKGDSCYAAKRDNSNY